MEKLLSQRKVGKNWKKNWKKSFSRSRRIPRRGGREKRKHGRGREDYGGSRTTVSSERSRARGGRLVVEGVRRRGHDTGLLEAVLGSRNVLDFRQKKQLHAVRATMQRPIARGGGRETGG